MKRWATTWTGAVMAIPLLWGGGPAPAAPAGDMLVSVDWLAEHLADRNLVILYVGRDTAYAAGHIPGARYLDLRAIVTDKDGLHYELPSPDSLRTAFAGLGVSDDSRIVLYFDTWGSPTTRAYFTLSYLGLGANTSILNGGLGAWRAAGQSVTTAAPAPAPRGSLRARPPADLVRDIAWVKVHGRSAGVRLVDARDERFYVSTEPSEMMREGHLPGAINIPYGSMFIENDGGLWFKPAAELRKIFDAAGVVRGERIVAYCHIGQQATAVWFAATSLGYEAVLYDGSFHGWSDAGEPVETP